ncbi:MAG: tetratricopeptide repeat protein [Betaproteobacteria bacterium]|nr:tetratricopeptide repeat protein [Betaproteobacteria bacterium]
MTDRQAPSQQAMLDILSSYHAADFQKAAKLANDLANRFPNHPFAWKVLGTVYSQSGQVEKALLPRLHSVRICPSDFKAHNNLGVVLKRLGRLCDAKESYREAIRIKPDYAQAHNNLGNILQAMGDLVEAEERYRRAVRIKPDYAEAYSNLGNVLQAMGALADAEASYRLAISLKPNYAEARWNLSMNLLLQGDFNEGLQLYESRWDGAEDAKEQRRHFGQPLWSGGNTLKGKTLLVHTEQGLGDTIHFCRYIKLVQQLGAEVIFEVQPSLVELLSNLDGVFKLVQRGGVLPSFDYHCPLLSLPLAFKTTLDSIPSEIPYLSTESTRVNRWKDHLGDDGFKVGICWHGTQNIKGRSVPIAFFHELSQIPSVRLISLHKGDGEKYLDSLPSGMRVETFDSTFDSKGAFLDTAAVMMCCDLVITIDTSIAHLAGALGVRTWVLLKLIPDWRWLLDRSDSPWYPNMRLFRQKNPDEWLHVFKQMTAVLNAELDQA